jgi:hypothetical protein
MGEDEAWASMVTNLEAKTGRTMADWVAVVNTSALDRHGEIVAMLKRDHGLGHGYANLVAHTARGTSALGADGDALLAAQYAGKKAGLRPIYDALLAVAQELGDGLEVAPKKAGVSLRRAKQFALITPATATRVDLGLNLKQTPPTGRLLATTGMCTHTVRLSSPAEVDDEVVGWLRQAWELSG